MVRHITRFSSSAETDPDLDALFSIGPNTLLVDSDAFLIASGAAADGANLVDAWTCSINGVVAGLATGCFGVSLHETNAGDSTSSSIKIGKTGDVFGTGTGIFADYGTGADHLSITNLGKLSGQVSAITSPVQTSIRNAGLLEGDVVLGAAGDSFINSAKSGKHIKNGTAFSAFHLGDGDNTFINPGKIQGGVFFGIGNDTMVNSGYIRGSVDLGDGNDVFTNFVKSGKTIKSGLVERPLILGIVASIDLGAGDDTFRGGNTVEVVKDDLGTDTYLLGGGNDIFLADDGFTNSNLDGDDIVNAGAGVDTYHLDDADSIFIVCIDFKAHETEQGTLEAQRAIEVFGQTDTIIGFENVIGGPGTDIIGGSDGANALNGEDNDDHLYGFGGRDVLTGGDGADTFHYESLSDSGLKASNRDIITDFFSDDLIDLSAIDANGTAAGEGAFSFIGFAEFTGQRGQLRAAFVNGSTIVSGDVTGDGKADFSIQLTGHVPLSATDFDL